MAKNLCFALTAALALCSAAAAADLDGRWSWSEAGRRGNSVTVVLTLKVNGNKLTGTITGGAMGRRGGDTPEEIKISGGKVNGNSFSFKVSQQGRGGMSMTTEYKGTLNEDTLELEITRPGMGPDSPPQVIRVTAERSLT